MQYRESFPHFLGGISAPGWRHDLLMTGLAMAAALYLSWLLPPTRYGWHALDAAVFHGFNAQLAVPGLFQSLVAWTNWRPFDLVSAAIIAGLLMLWLRAADSTPTQKKLAQLIAFCALLLAGKICQRLLLEFTGYDRLSPTLVYPDAVRLAKLVPWIATKDHASTTFPGDHAFVVFTCVGFLWIQMGRRIGLIAALVLIPFTLPRVIVGAHWATDVLVGGTMMALTLLSLGYATPFAENLASAIEKVARRPLQSCIRLGRRFHVLR